MTFAKLLTELHQGTISVESELGVGTTFTVNLPIYTDAVIEELPQEAPNTFEGEIMSYSDYSEIILEHNLSGSLVYIVDDNPELLNLLSEIIGVHFKVKTFTHGAAVLEALDEEWPDLIVSDVMMPEMDGYELCDRIKGDVKISHIPVILLTACSTVDDKIKGLQVGADAYIPKPFYPKHLITRIETLLYNRQVLRERFQIGIPLAYSKDKNTSAMDNEFMTKLYELFNANLDNEEINLDTIARELGQNRSLFFRKVKAITNTTPNELLKEYRVTKAAELLQDGRYNVNEVCMMIGFKDRSHFSRVFKAKYGITPSKYVQGAP